MHSGRFQRGSVGPRIPVYREPFVSHPILSRSSEPLPLAPSRWNSSRFLFWGDCVCFEELVEQRPVINDGLP